MDHSFKQLIINIHTRTSYPNIVIELATFTKSLNKSINNFSRMEELDEKKWHSYINLHIF